MFGPCYHLLSLSSNDYTWLPLNPDGPGWCLVIEMEVTILMESYGLVQECVTDAKILKRMFNERIDRFYTHRQKERNQQVRLRYARAGNSESHGSHGVHVVSHRATAITRRVGSGSEAPARCPKDVKISAPIRDRFRYVQSLGTYANHSASCIMT